MKKLLCILFSFFFIISASIYVLATSAQQNVDEISAEEFANEVGSLIRANEANNMLPGNESHKNSTNDEFQTARLIVKSRNKLSTLNAISVVNGYDDLWVLQFAEPSDAKYAFEYYSSLSNVEFVEVDKEISALTVNESSNSIMNADEEASFLSWGPEHIGIDKLNSNLEQKFTPLTDTVVAVVDTGVDPDHPYLKGRILPTRINTSSSGIRNDSMDDNGHGTQVAGVIVDSTLDNIYVKAYKVLDNRGKGTLVSLAAGINCAVNDGVDIINISVGFKEESEVLKAAVDNAEINDILVIAAAGNDGTDTPLYPASYDNVVKVTAINSSNIVPNFSSYGYDVDFAAPGVSIKTTTLNGSYTTTRGTSVAAPFVSSVAATLQAMNCDASAEDILETLIENAVQISEHNAELKYGNGIIRAPEGLLPSGKEKTATPYFSHETAFSQTEIDIEIFCNTPGAVIYYTTDKSIPSKTNPNSMIYDGTPIHATQTIIIYAVAYCEGMYRSSVNTFATIVAPVLDENTLTIDSSGTIISYKGNAVSFTLPETVNGTTVKSIGPKVFAETNVTEVILPASVTKIEAEAFKGCKELKTIYGKNITVVESQAFYDCIWLKNVFLLSELKSIGEYAFYNAGSKQYVFTGSTFSLKLKSLNSIPKGVFMGSSVSAVEFGNISTIGENAFLECNQLVNVYFDNLANIPDGCFKGCESLYYVEIHGLTYISTGAFSSCEKLITVNIPAARSINSNAFENCISLINVELPSAVTVYSNAFSGCKKLITLNLPSMKNFEPTIYDQVGIYPLLPENLETFSAPKMTKTVSNMFKSCPDILNIYLNSATEIAPNTFNGCSNIYFINLESVQHLNEKTFNNCKALFIDARNLITTADMPDNSGILLSNNFIESTDKATNLTVYGTPGTFVERYSKLKGYDFVAIPLIFNEIPEYVTENSERIYVLAVGFDLTYQWYWNTVPSTEGGTPIDGANTMSYTFTDKDTAPYYYCEITQNDLNVISKITTNLITKDTKPADYTAYNEAVERANSINRSMYSNLALLDAALNVDVSNRYSCEQNIVDAQTKAINDAIANLKVKVVKSINLYASETELELFEAERIITVFQPIDARYENTEWISDNPNVLLVSQTGYVRCIGDGTVDVRIRVTNADGTITEGIITFECNLTPFEKVVAFMFKFIFILAAKA